MKKALEGARIVLKTWPGFKLFLVLQTDYVIWCKVLANQEVQCPEDESNRGEMLGWCGHSKRDKIGNEDTRAKVGVAHVEDKMQ